MKQKSYTIAMVGGCLSSYGGGAPRSMAHQARSLQKQGHKVTLFTGKSKQYPFTPEELGIQKIPTYASTLWGPSVLGFFPAALKQLWKDAAQFDLIHLNGAWNLTTFLGARIALWRKTPYIISCRSHYGDYHFSRRPLLKKFLFQCLEKSSIRHAYGLHITADWEKETSWRAIQIAKRIIKIPNPVNLTDFTNPPLREVSRKELNLNPNGFYLVHLGRLGAQKNLSLLFNAFKQAHLDKTSKLILIGPPESVEKKKLQQLARHLNLEDNIEFIDFVKGRKRCLWLAAADLFTLPSNDENFCIATIEAAASGTFSLLSPQVGAIEYMPDNLVKVLPSQISNWANELTQYAQSPPQQLLNDRTWLDQFSQETITLQWVKIYAQLKTGDEHHE